jgi:predicted RNase H-like HicB family nuclease
MCSENQNDIPIRTVVVEKDRVWVAHCLDFGLQAKGKQPDEAVDSLDEAISVHLKRAKAGEVTLFPSLDPEVVKLYHRAAASKLLASGPGHGHVEHRAILLQPTAAS